jgi:ATP-dependent Lon protease
MIRRYTREAGVRSLERIIASLCRKVARAAPEKEPAEKKYRLTAQSALKYLGWPKYRYGLAEENDEIGLATGLAWTEVGGELLQIEVTLMPGAGKLTITGKLGDVMQESAQAALSYVRSRAKLLGWRRTFTRSSISISMCRKGRFPRTGRRPGSPSPLQPGFGPDQVPVAPSGDDRRDHPARAGSCPSAA